MNNKVKTLLPIGTRVTHWDGKRGTHGKGTIIAYNGVSPDNYLRTNFKDAVEIAAKAGLLGGLVTASYDGGRYPYVVQFDPRQILEGETEQEKTMREKYPRGYKDVYGVDDTLRIEPAESIFPNNTVQIMARHWHEDRQEWSSWEEVSKETYEVLQSSSDAAQWQLCVR